METDSSDGRKIHHVIIAIIKRDDKYLLMDRVNEPNGIALPMGHVKKDEDLEEALRREAGEETGLTVKSSHLILEREGKAGCRHGGLYHKVHVYEVLREEGEVRPNKEAKSMMWYTVNEIRGIEPKLEKFTKYCFRQIGVL